VDGLTFSHGNVSAISIMIVVDGLTFSHGN
jgi:hypothetical protein